MPPRKSKEKKPKLSGQSAKTLGNTLSRVNEVRSSLDEAIKAMSALDLKKISVTHYKTAMRGLDWLESFASAVAIEIRQETRRREVQAGGIYELPIEENDEA